METINGINDIQLTPNFNLKEFQDPNTGEVKIWFPLVSRLQCIRDVIGEPMKVLSGYRTPETNKKMKYAVPNSAHLYGLAADIQIPSKRYNDLARIAGEFGIPRIKIYPSGEKYGNGWIHLGFNDYKIR